MLRALTRASFRQHVRSLQTASSRQQPDFGLIVPTLTPFKNNGDVDYDGLRKYINFLVKNGIRSVFLNGTTAEFPSLSIEERKKIQSVYLDYGRSHGLENVIVQCGSPCLRDAIELAKHARANGANRIASIAPYYTPPRSVETLLEYCSAICNAVPDTAFYYYHISAFTRCTVSLREFLTAADRRLPNLEGLKFSDADLGTLIWCLHYGAPQSGSTAEKTVTGRYVVLTGAQELCLAKWAHGAQHDGIGTQFNIIPGLFKSLRAAFNRGDLLAASRDQFRVNCNAEIVNRYTDHATSATLRDILSLIGLDLGPSRSPLKRLPKARLELLRKDLDASGFSEFCAKV